MGITDTHPANELWIVIEKAKRETDPIFQRAEELGVRIFLEDGKLMASPIDKAGPLRNLVKNHRTMLIKVLKRREQLEKLNEELGKDLARFEAGQQGAQVVYEFSQYDEIRRWENKLEDWIERADRKKWKDLLAQYRQSVTNILGRAT